MKELKKRRRCLSKVRDSSITPQFSLSKASKTSFPFLTLLGEICAYIENNDNNNNDIYAEETSSISHSEDVPLIDKDLYPFSHYLQNLIKKAKLHRPRSVLKCQKKDETLILVMRALEYPFLTQKCDGEGEYSFASRLKSYASKSEEFITPEDNDSAISDIRYILQKLFPYDGYIDNDNFIYSKKLKTLSNCVKLEYEAFDIHMPYTFLHNTLKDSDDSSSSLHFNTLSSSCSGENYENNRDRRNDISKTLESRISVQKEKDLFEALMNNVHLQSLINHRNIEYNNDNGSSAKSPLDNRSNTGTTIVEKILLQHFQNKWDM
ncbi:UNVERIFIED_CONTAM: hypothetical protein RMT77_001043 [Armadillidium vulgare]